MKNFYERTQDDLGRAICSGDMDTASRAAGVLGHIEFAYGSRRELIPFITKATPTPTGGYIFTLQMELKVSDSVLNGALEV